MIGAIKRRWKSKKAKVLHKGSELSTSSDSCPTSRGFVVDGCEDFEKMIKPPSPRQVHPVLEKDVKYGHHNVHHQHHHQTTHQLLQHPVRKKSSTLPSSDEGCPFIRVNSGRIELVSNKESSASPWKSGEPNEACHRQGKGSKGFQDSRRMGGRNDSRHSWCGSAVRELEVAHKKRSGAVLLQEQVGRVPITNSVSGREPSQLSPQLPTTCPPPVPSSLPPGNQMAVRESGDSTCSSPSSAGGGNPRVLLSPLKERLAAIEEIAANLQNWQAAEKNEYERCVSDLASQVSRAVTLQQMMKSEVEKLQQRVVDLENHNKAMATMIIPTLMKLHDTVGKENASQSTIGTQSESPKPEEKVERKSPKHRKIDCRIPRISSRSNTGNNGSSPNQNPHNQSSRYEPALNSKQQQSPAIQQQQQQSQQLRQQQMDEISNESKSDCQDASPGSLSPSSKSETHSSNKGSSSVKSSSFSGIPRMSSPRPALQKPVSKETRLRKSESPRNAHDSHTSLPSANTSSASTNANSNNASNSSRLPVRRNLGGTGSQHKTSNTSLPSSTEGKTRLRSISNHEKHSSFKNTGSLTITKTTRNSASPTIIMTSSAPSSTDSSAVKSKVTSTGTKDEGYSTMSSEALAEQEKSDVVVAGAGGMGNSSGQRENANKSKTMHKSSTFNTFREMGDNYGLGSGSCAKGKLIMTEPRNFTSLPSSTARPTITTTATKATVVNGRKPTSSSPSYTSSTTSSSVPTASKTSILGNVRIIRGIPCELEEGEMDEQSSATILWEDSDDSDILFLPLEMSSASSSRSTLIPSCQDTNGSPAWKGLSPGPHREVAKSGSSKGDKEKASLAVAAAAAGLLANGGLNGEDRSLIEKWMRLEDVRNEVQWDDEWAWDWDGVQQPTQKSLRSIREAEADDDDYEELWFPPPHPSSSTSEQRKESDDFQSSSTTANPVESLGLTLNPEESPEKLPAPPISQIDSSTWTKTKCGKIKSKLVQIDDESLKSCEFLKGSNSLEKSSMVGSSSSSRKKVVPSPSTHLSSALLRQSETDELRIEERLLINEHCHPSGGENNETPSMSLDGCNGEDGTPPVIEFTPEYYHLVNYGSNLSFSDNESNSNSPYHPFHGGGGESRDKGKSNPSCNKVSRKSKTFRTDDKVSQTDFTSSHENMSSSTELFTECRNCLEIIKKLVAEDCCSASPSTVTTLDRKHAEQGTDAGCPTTWLSVPKGLPTTEVDRILEILSSSESEDVLSPSK